MDDSGNNDLLHHQLHQKPQNQPMSAFHVSTASGPYRNFSPSQHLEAGAKRGGFPPTSPYSQFNGVRAPPLFSPDGAGSGAGAPQADDVCMDDGSGAAKNGLPPRRAHRRSQSDIPLAFFQSTQAISPGAGVRLPFLNSGRAQGVKIEGSFDANGDDLFNAYMNLEGLDALNSSEENREELNSRDSGSKTNGGGESSDNEAESNGRMGLWSGGENGAGKAGLAVGSRHCRSLSMDSFMGKLNFGDGSQKGTGVVGFSAKSGDAGPNSFSLEFGNGEFTAAEMKKIMANEKLVELAMADPKRVKRILANRQSAARSKERKMRYIAELEHKVQALQTEATTLSAQLTLLQRDSAGLATQNNELKFRIQAMEQQAQLRDALNEALTAEVQRLKLAATGHVDSHTANNLNQQTSVTSHLFQMQQKQQSAHISLYQLQKQNENDEETSE